MSTPPISREDAGRALDALLGFLCARAKQRKAQLFEHDDFLYLHISVRRFPSISRTNPYRISLPHTLHPLDRSRTSLCLIVADAQAEAARTTADAEKLPFDSVIPISELRTDYIPFESRRRLCDSYDIFFAERSIVTLLPRLIGNYFFKKKKIPLAINISRPGWPEAVRQVCRSTCFFYGSGTGIGMKVGRISMDREDIVDNLMAIIDGAVKHVPKKWANIRSMCIKSVHSVALPIYQAVPEIGMKISSCSMQKDEILDVIVTQENAGKKKSEKGKKKLQKGKGRIHDIDFTCAQVVYKSGDNAGEEELGMEKTDKMLKKENISSEKSSRRKLQKGNDRINELVNKIAEDGAEGAENKEKDELRMEEMEKGHTKEKFASEKCAKQLRKRKGKIQDVDNVCTEFADKCGDDEGEGVDEQKGRTADFKNDGKEREIENQLIALGNGRKRPKKSKKIVNCDMDDHVLEDGLEVATGEVMLSKDKRKQTMKRKGSKHEQESIGVEKDANYTNLSTSKKRVKNSEQSDEDKKIKKGRKTKSRCRADGLELDA